VRFLETKLRGRYDDVSERPNRLSRANLHRTDSNGRSRNSNNSSLYLSIEEKANVSTRKVERIGILGGGRICVYRPALHRHTVRVPYSGCWTFLITGPEIRQWGFWLKGRFRKRNKFFHIMGHHPCD
jgi:hypothetical protein